jgi:F-type H+-transporting ATPase subunit epsilon
MPHTKFPCEVLTPEGEAFNDEVEQVSTRTTLGPTELRLYRSDSEILRYAQGEGFMQVADSRALLLVGEATPIEELDRAELESSRARALQLLETTPEDSEARARAARQLKRAETFLGLIGADARH